MNRDAQDALGTRPKEHAPGLLVALDATAAAIEAGRRVGYLELLAVALEIANDSRCDLVDSERRIRLYAAITKAGGVL